MFTKKLIKNKICLFRIYASTGSVGPTPPSRGPGWVTFHVPAKAVSQSSRFGIKKTIQATTKIMNQNAGVIGAGGTAGGVGHYFLHEVPKEFLKTCNTAVMMSNSIAEQVDKGVISQEVGISQDNFLGIGELKKQYPRNPRVQQLESLSEKYSSNAGSGTNAGSGINAGSGTNAESGTAQVLLTKGGKLTKKPISNIVQHMPVKPSRSHHGDAEPPLASLSMSLPPSVPSICVSTSDAYLSPSSSKLFMSISPSNFFFKTSNFVKYNSYTCLLLLLFTMVGACLLNSFFKYQKLDEKEKDLYLEDDFSRFNRLDAKLKEISIHFNQNSNQFDQRITKIEKQLDYFFGLNLKEKVEKGILSEEKAAKILEKLGLDNDEINLILS